MDRRLARGGCRQRAPRGATPLPPGIRPSKADDFARWSGFGRDASRALFAELADELQEVRVDRSRAWLLEEDGGGFDPEARTIRLLPRYDAYVIGFRPRDALVPRVVNEHVKQDAKGRWESVTGMAPLVVDGVVTGFWQRDGPRIEVEHVVPLARGRRRELNAAVERVQDALS